MSIHEVLSRPNWTRTHSWCVEEDFLNNIKFPMYVSITEVASLFSHVTRHAGMIAVGTSQGRLGRLDRILSLE